jgi:trans-aconitate 2-methyltransferase
MTDWDPELYNRFQRYRSEPAEMLIAQLEIGATEKIIDFGCGTGENTVALAERTPHGFALGIDSSPAMIARAEALREGLTPKLRSRVEFRIGDFSDYREGASTDGYTIVFSNAALQWVRGHREALAQWHRELAPGGQLAVQMPANESETAQMTIVALAREEPWRTLAGKVEMPSHQVAEPDEYAVMLRAIGFSEVDCRYHVFHHPMASIEEVVEWHRATALRPLLDRIPIERQGEFLDELTRRLESAYRTRGPMVFNFRRLFLRARRAAR